MQGLRKNPGSCGVSIATMMRPNKYLVQDGSRDFTAIVLKHADEGPILHQEQRHLNTFNMVGNVDEAYLIPILKSSLSLKSYDHTCSPVISRL